MMRNIKLTIFGEEREYNAETTCYDIARDYQDRVKSPILLVSINHQLRELHHKVKEDGVLEFVTIYDPAGAAAYERRLLMLLRQNTQLHWLNSRPLCLKKQLPERHMKMHRQRLQLRQQQSRKSRQHSMN